MTTTNDQVTPTAELSGDYELDPAHTRLGFVARHAMVSKVRGSIGVVDGRLHIDAEDPSRSSAEITADMETITTSMPQRDEHLRSADFFDTKSFPQLTFRSTKAEAVGDGEYRMTGDLTVRGQTRPITLNIEFTGAARDPYGNDRVGFEVRGELSRKEWGITWNAVLESGGVMVGDKVKLEIDVEAIKAVLPR